MEYTRCNHPCVSMGELLLLAMTKKCHFKTAKGTMKRMAGGGPARRKDEESCRIVRLFNDDGHRLAPFQATNPYDQPPKGRRFILSNFLLQILK